MKPAPSDFPWLGVLALLLAGGLAAASLALPLPAVPLGSWAAAAPALACLVAVGLLLRRQPAPRLLVATGVALLVYGATTAAHGLARDVLAGVPPADAIFTGFFSGVSAAVGFLAAWGAVAALGRVLFSRRGTGAGRPLRSQRVEPRTQGPRPPVPVPALPRPGGALAAAAAGGPGNSFARAPIRRDVKPGPRVTRAPEEGGAGPGPPASPAVLSVDPPRPAGAPPRPPAAPRPAEPPPASHPAVPVPPVLAAGGGWRADVPEPLVKISFRRIADQFPADAFVVDLDQVEAGLVERGVLLVPQRLLVPQLPEGVTQVAWEDVADQFPAAALAGPGAALKHRLTEGRLLLPIDEVIAQLPAAAFALGVPVMDVRGIAEFPSPFGFERDDETEAAAGAMLAAPAAGEASPDGPRARDPIETEEAAPPPDPAPGSCWGDIVLAEEVAGDADELPDAAPAVPAAVETGLPTTLRIGFGRIASQFPAEAFRMPVDRVAANLLEPGQILVPRRLAEPQLAEGVVRVAWEDIASQFPPQSLALTAEELSARIAGGTIALPLDEVVSQLSPETFAMPAARPDLLALEAFPEPFQVGPSRAPQDLAPAGAAPESARVMPADPGPHLRSGAGAPVPTPGGPASDGRERAAIRRVGESLVLEEPGPPIAQVDAAAAPVESTPPGVAAPPGRDSAIEMFAHALAPAGSFEASAARVDGLDVVVFGAPGLPAGEIREVVRRVTAALGDVPGSWRLEQVTVRGAEGALVITPAGAPDPVSGRPGRVVVAAVPRGGTLARIEQLCLTAGGGTLPAGAGMAAPPLEQDDSALTEKLVRVAAILDAFGPVQPRVFRDPSRELLLYVYAPPGDDAAAFGTLARTLYHAVTGGPAPLGALDSVACRASTHRVMLRPVPGAPGRAAVLVAAGTGHGRPGLAHLQVQRAAAHLGTL